MDTCAVVDYRAIEHECDANAHVWTSDRICGRCSCILSYGWPYAFRTRTWPGNPFRNTNIYKRYLDRGWWNVLLNCSSSPIPYRKCDTGISYAFFWCVNSQIFHFGMWLYIDHIWNVRISGALHTASFCRTFSGRSIILWEKNLERMIIMIVLDRCPSSSYSFFLFLQCMCEESHRRYLNFGHFELLSITLRHCPDGYCCISLNLVLLFSNAHLNVS